MFGKVFMKNGSLVRKYLTALVFCFIFVSCSSTNSASANLSKMKRTGNVSNVNLETKDFITMGIIFVTSSVKFDDDDEIISGSKITFEMLMKEAQKLGADDIVNLRIDEVETTHSDYSRTITYTATALAIKYVPTVHK